MIRGLALSALFALSSCALPVEPLASRSAVSPLPPMKVFANAAPEQPARSNREIARDILDLTFQLESGRALSTFSRFEGPITVALTGAPAPKTLERDLDQLIARLREEAQLPITRTDATEGSIRVEVIDKASMRNFDANVACIVVPGNHDFVSYSTAHNGAQFRWENVRHRTQATAFIPGDVSPQEARDCMHEEIAQALGPLNDLFRLTDSIFNDDNFHSILTGFDVLVLRALYAPELRSGMSQSQFARALPRVLARINPSGEDTDTIPRLTDANSWRTEVKSAIDNTKSKDQRRSSAQRALELSANSNWGDARYAYSHFLVGTLSLSHNRAAALEHFLAADTAYARLPKSDVQRAHIALYLAAIALRQGQTETTIDITTRASIAAARTENAALLSMLLMLRSEALRLEGRKSEARTVRMDSFGWARYGFGSNEIVRARWDEITRFAPRN